MTALQSNKTVYDIIFEQDVEAIMRDGTILRADIVRPATDEKKPVMLTRTPYGKRGLVNGHMLDMPELARQGYVCITQDTRTRFASEGKGEFHPFVPDTDDGYDTVAWAAALPYANGDVFMTGHSYTGLTQWSAATQKPPALRGIVPGASPSTPLRTLAFRGGVLELGGLAAWFIMMGFDTLMKRHRDDPARMGAALQQLMADAESLNFGGFDALPVAAFPPIVRNDIGEHFFPMLTRDMNLPTLATMRDAQAYEKVEVPAFITVGWYDYFISGSIDQYVGMKARAGTQAARDGTKLVVGPWNHTNFWGAITGERNFGMGATIGMINPGAYSGVAKDFADRITAGTLDEIPTVRIFVMGANVWREEQEWPLARTQMTPWHLGSGGSANSASGDGVLAPDAAAGAARDTFAYDPAGPVPTWGGINLGMSELSGPRDQAPVEKRQDVLVYTSAPLNEPVEVTGTAWAELWVTTDAPDTDFIARLVDVSPDGTAWNIADGVLRMRFRDGPEGTPAAEPVEPGKPYLLRIELTPTSNLFKAGHRIRLDVTSSSFPRLARNLNIWDDTTATLADAKVARNAVLHDAEHPSRIVLPIIPCAT